MKKYELPAFLVGKVTEGEYKHWLDAKASAHFRRDKKRRNIATTRKEYKEAIHQAVKESRGKDAYTDEELDWTLISKYDNKESKKQGRQYRIKFAPLPTIDHNDRGKGVYEFKICSWRTNDAKNDLSYNDFLELCKRIIAVANSRL